jgi:hypothetical protein
VIAALGVFGFMNTLWALRASAQDTFSDANYSGRYGCEISFDEDFFTAVYKYNPNGAGGYANGTLIGSLNNFAVFDNTAPASQFCTYFLKTAPSVYSIDSTGVGSETLSWTPSVTNNLACPGAFTDETFIVLHNISQNDQNGASIRAEVADRNFFGIDPGGNAGHGTCVK